MSNHQPNVWQTAGRGGRHSHSASRTPQNRSGTASPAQSQAPTQPPKDTNPPAAPRTQPSPHPPVPAAPNSSTTNVWAQRATAGPGGSNGQQPQQPQAAAAAGGNPSSSTPNPTSSPAFASLEDSGPSTHGFNAAETKAFLAREPAPTAYKPSEDLAAGGATAGAAASGAVGGNNRPGGGGAGGGGPWGVKANHTANNQPFFVQLAKQIAAFEGGG